MRLHDFKPFRLYPKQFDADANWYVFKEDLRQRPIKRFNYCPFRVVRWLNRDNEIKKRLHSLAI